MPLLVAVGSANPVKRRAVLEAVRVALAPDDLDVVARPVRPSVPAQPFGDAQTLRGARERASAAALAVPGADFAIGVEGGLVSRDGQLESMAWVVVDGRGPDGATLRSEARTATFVLPVEIAERVRAGAELGTATDEVLAVTRLARSSGTVGPLTGGMIDRIAYYAHALVLALIPFRDANSALTFPIAGVDAEPAA